MDKVMDLLEQPQNRTCIQNFNLILFVIKIINQGKQKYRLHYLIFLMSMVLQIVELFWFNMEKGSRIVLIMWNL